MFDNAALVEQAAIVSIVLPKDMHGSANPGDWVSMKNYDKCTFIVHKGKGTDGQDPAFTLTQSAVVAGSNPKPLKLTTVWLKQGADLKAIGGFTRVDQADATAALGVYTNTDSAQAEGLYVIEVKAEDLDRDNGFDCVNLSWADVGGNAQIGGAIAILWGARYAGAGLVSAIID